MPSLGSGRVLVPENTSITVAPLKSALKRTHSDISSPAVQTSESQLQKKYGKAQLKNNSSSNGRVMSASIPSVNAAGPTLQGNTLTIATPLKSALKRTYGEISSQETPATEPQARKKKCKVQFNDAENETKVFYQDKPIALVKAEVLRALQRHLAGDSSEYLAIRELFTLKSTAVDAPTPITLGRYVQALTANTNLINKKCGALVDSILECNWIGRDEEFCTSYRNLLANLISAHGAHARPVLEALVEKFATLRSYHGRLPNHAVVNLPQLRQRLHATIALVLNKSPSSLSTLSGVLSSSFPYTTETARAYVSYVSNLLMLAQYKPALKSEILSLTIEKMVNVDVQIQTDIEDLEEELDEKLLEDIVMTLDRNEDGDDDSDSDSADDQLSTVDTNPAQKRLQDLKQTVTKLDAILDMLFDHCNSAFTKSPIADKELLFNQMISIFNRSILPTYRSRHVQFILFHFAQTSPSLTEKFANSLTSVIFDKNQPTMVKRSAAAYLASFIARSVHVPPYTVHDTFLSLSKELDRLRTLHEKNANCCPDLNRFGTYYSIAQALLYIFCFRWRDLLIEEEEEDDDDVFDVNELRWQFGVKEAFERNFHSPLNPLKVCAPGIVTQFAAVAHHLKFMYIYSKIEVNKRIRLTRSVASGYGGMERETSLSNKTGESMFQLDAYFPFDPYTLPRSQRWLTDDYRGWKAVPGMETEEDEVDESEEEDEIEDEEMEFDEPTETESDAHD